MKQHQSQPKRAEPSRLLTQASSRSASSPHSARSVQVAGAIQSPHRQKLQAAIASLCLTSLLLSPAMLQAAPKQQNTSSRAAATHSYQASSQEGAAGETSPAKEAPEEPEAQAAPEENDTSNFAASNATKLEELEKLEPSRSWQLGSASAEQQLAKSHAETISKALAPQGLGAPLLGPLAKSKSPQNLVYVVLESTEPGARISVYRVRDKIKKSTPLISCLDKCTFKIPPGQYKFYIEETPDTVSGSRNITVSQDVHLLIDPDTVTHRSTGLALGIAGPILMVSGMVAIMVGAIRSIGHDDSGSDAWVGGGVAMLIGGLAITPVGWVMFGTSFKPEWEEIPLSRQSAKNTPKAPSWELGFAPSPQGGNLGFSLSF